MEDTLSTTLPAGEAEDDADFCELLASRKPRVISRLAYDALVAEAGEYDLFINATTMACQRSHPASVRSPEGGVKPVPLSATECAALAHLVRKGHALSARDFKFLGVGWTVRLIERARKKVDHYENRRWRAFQTLSKHGDTETRWQFNPPQGFRYAILCPLAGVTH